MRALARIVLLSTALLGFTAPPAQAAPVGTGTLAGRIDYVGAGPPSPLAPCRPVSFTIEATSLTASIGTLAFDGSGSGFCESATLGGGHVSLSADFVAADGTVYDCPTMSGTYTRVAYDLVVVATALCTVNTYGWSRLVLTVRAVLVPDTPYGWFVGTFTITPA